MEKRKKSIMLVCAIVLLALAGAVAVLTFGTKKSLQISFGSKTDEQIRKEFNCDRITADVRETDVYCNYPELARGELPTIERIRLSMSCDDPHNTRANDYESCSNTQKYQAQLRKYLR